MTGQLEHAKSRNLRPGEEIGTAKTLYDVTAGAGNRRRAHKTCHLQPYYGTDGTAKT